MPFGQSRSFARTALRSRIVTRTLLSVFFCLAATQVSFAAAKPAPPAGHNPTQNQSADARSDNNSGEKMGKDGKVMRHPKENRLLRAKPFNGDLRTLPQTAPEKAERPERDEPEVDAVPYPGTAPASPDDSSNINSPGANAPAPAPSGTFEGLDFANWGAGHPPDTNGDVGKDYYIQSVNTSLGIYRKSDGVRLAAFTFNTFMSQGAFGNLCDSNNFGDPVVMYDTFEDRWVVTDFAFKLDNTGAVVNPPGAFQCFAVSKTGDPLAGGWNFYSLHITDFLNDYPKFGIWPDGIYMAANMFAFPAGGTYQGSRVWALNKAQMYAGAPTIQVVTFDAPVAEFTLLPSNARLQAGTPPPGTPNYVSVVRQFTNVISFYKFHVDWNSISTSTLSGPFLSIAPASWANPPASVPSFGGNNLDTLAVRLMMQNQYTNLGGVESLWNAHTVRGATATQSAIRYYQVNVTGGAVSGTTTQASTFNPDTTNRFMPSVAVDRAGNMAMGYSTTSSTQFPAIRYAGRLFADPLNTITQTETSLIEGTGTQLGNCGSSACIRWGDYSAMSLDVDGCTFWYTNMYYQVSGLNDHTRIGSFRFPGCTNVSSGSVQGTVTAAGSGNPISGATVALGSRTTTTDANGFYSFSALASGTYPTIAASAVGYNAQSSNSVVVTDGATTTRDFALNVTPAIACLTDTTQADFQTGVPTKLDLTSSPGDLILLASPSIDQQNLSVTNSGFGVNATNWAGQTFVPAVTGQLSRVDLDLFCSGCTGTTPNFAVEIRAVSGSLPTGSAIATATIPGFSSGAGGFFSANFTTPATLTAGTAYAILFHPVSNPSAGTYAYVVSAANPYAAGSWIASSNSGVTWAIATSGGTVRDLGFKTFMKTGFTPTGNLVSSLKDSNPAIGSTATWNSLSWTAATPANTTLQIQAAGSNNAAGPFNFVGPDGTASSFFNSGASLSQFNGSRYLKYLATLNTTNSSLSPTVNDVTVCYDSLSVTTLTVSAANGAFGGTTDLSATLTAHGSGISGKTVNFTLNGNNVGSGITDASGIATVTGVSLAGIDAGTYAGAIGATFAGDDGNTASNGSSTLTVTQAGQAITFAAIPNHQPGDAPFTVSASASSGLPVSFAIASGPATISGNTVTLTGPTGTVTVRASQAGDLDHTAAPDVERSFEVGYATCVLYDQNKVSKSGSTIPIKLTICSSTGVNLSSAATVVTAVKLNYVATSTGTAANDSGNANPDGNFRFDPTLAPGGGYIFNLSTKGLASGTWQLVFTVSGDNTQHPVSFKIN